MYLIAELRRNSVVLQRNVELKRMLNIELTFHATPGSELHCETLEFHRKYGTWKYVIAIRTSHRKSHRIAIIFMFLERRGGCIRTWINQHSDLIMLYVHFRYEVLDKTSINRDSYQGNFFHRIYTNKVCSG